MSASGSSRCLLEMGVQRSMFRESLRRGARTLLDLRHEDAVPRIDAQTDLPAWTGYMAHVQRMICPSQYLRFESVPPTHRRLGRDNDEFAVSGLHRRDRREDFLRSEEQTTEIKSRGDLVS